MKAAWTASVSRVPNRSRVRRPFAFALLLSCSIFAFSVLTASTVCAEDPKPYKIEFGMGLGWIHRATNTENSKAINATYDAGFGQTLFLRTPLWPWLNIGAFYQRAYHSINIPAGSLEPPGSTIDLGSMLCFSIGGRLQPSISITPRLRLWLTLGAAWGRITTPRMDVITSYRSYTVAKREGVLVEIPLGLGAAYEILPGWLALTFETTYAPHSAQSGSLYENTQFVDSAGNLGHTLPFPMLRHSLTQMFGLSLLL